MKDYFLQMFLTLEILTPLVTQALKVTLDGLKAKYNSTLVALIVAILLTVGASAFVIITNGLTLDTTNVCYIVALVLLNWVGATIGYDKVKELFNKNN